jgi:hypothetical protein
MSIKTRQVEGAIKRIKTKLKKIDDFLTANPLSRIAELRNEALVIMENNKDDPNKLAEQLGPLALVEKELFKIARLQSKPGVTGRKIDEKVNLRIDLAILERELKLLNQEAF